VAFTVEDFQDLLRLLEARPEWRAKLRRLLIPEEVLGLPAAVRQLADEVRLLADAQRRTEIQVSRLVEVQARAEQRLSGVDDRAARLEEGQARLESALTHLAGAQARTEERVIRLEEGQVRLESALTRLAEAQVRTEERLNGVDGRLSRVEGRLAGLRGDNLEQRYRQHAGGYFGRLLRRARIVSPDELDDLLDEGLPTGAFDEDSAHDVRLADLVVRGRRPGEERDTYLVVEVSGVVEPADVEQRLPLRASRR
jgi:exonuclease VII small subunit